jgi:hypothetical protein
MQPQEILLNDLPNWTDWPARLLGVREFKTVVRDRAKIDAEYSKDKWQKCLDAFETSAGTATATDLRRQYYDLNSSKLRACVLDNKVVSLSNDDLMAHYDNILLDGMKSAVESCETIVELGCGFGHILWMLRRAFPGKEYRGGDYAGSAVELGKKLYHAMPDISVQKFDFYASSYDIIENAKGPVVVLTSQALEQIPSSAQVVETLAKYKSKISRVFHLEPAYALYDDSLLGLMRRRYIEINDYNRDLVSTLQTRSDVEFLRMEANAIGWNPFNSLAMMEWRFK